MNLATICGNIIPPSIDSYENEVTLLFHSDQTNNRKTGFIIRVNASVEGKGNVISWVTGFQLKTYAPECGGQIEGSSGVIQSPGYPSGYPHRHICRWIIKSTDVTRRVKLEFEDFDLEMPRVDQRNSSRCRYDYVYVKRKHQLKYLS